MNISLWLKRLTTGKVVLETTSPINGKIQVVEDISGKRLVVKGLTQSGGQVKRVWEKAIKEIRNGPSSLLRSFEEARKWERGNCLILGLGAGTLAQLVSQKWPKAKITGVEIDPKIIEVGKKYFSLDKIPNLKIILSDAARFISKLEIPRPELGTKVGNCPAERDPASREKLEIIFIDLYLADRVPPQCETIDFLKYLKKLLAPKGLVVFNRLYYKIHKGKTEVFLDKLEKVFHIIKRKKVGSNLLVFADKPQ